MTALRRLGARLRGERGYTLVELVTTVAILGIVLAGLTTLFAQASNAELHQNNRFQAQLNARLALDKIRRDAHGACAATAVTTTSVTLDLAPCNGSTDLSWCTSGAGSRFGIYRQSGGACSSAGTKHADYLIVGTVFSYGPQSSSSLAKLYVDLRVNIRPSRTTEDYRLCDGIVLRNSRRTGSSTPVASPC